MQTMRPPINLQADRILYLEGCKENVYTLCVVVAESDKVTCSSCNHHCLPKGPSTAGEGTCVCYTGYSYQDGLCQGTGTVLL